MFKGFFLVLLATIQITQAGQNCPKGSNGELVYYKHYSLSFRNDHKIPEWTCYDLLRGMSHGQAQREGQAFKEENRVNSAQPSEYLGKGYDRGHMVPADDMSFDLLAMSETFYMSNIAPQVPAMNRGIWRRVEDRMRKLANDYGEITIVTGPVLSNSFNRIPGTKITIPNAFFKVAYYYQNGLRKMEAYLVPNKESQSDISSFRVQKAFAYNESEDIKVYLSDLEEIEVITGLDL